MPKSHRLMQVAPTYVETGAVDDTRIEGAEFAHREHKGRSTQVPDLAPLPANDNTAARQ